MSDNEIMIIKEELKTQLESMPEQFTLDELVERLILLEKIQKGLDESSRNEVLSEEEVDERINSWFK